MSKRMFSAVRHIINRERDHHFLLGMADLTVVENSLAFSQNKLIGADPVTLFNHSVCVCVCV